MKNLIEVLSYEEHFADTDLEVWVTSVKIAVVNNGDREVFTFQVKMDTRDIWVVLSDMDIGWESRDVESYKEALTNINEGGTRMEFAWNDYMLTNCNGSIQKASILCALAVVMSEDLATPVFAGA